MSSRAMTNARMPLQILQSIFILRQSARMFYLRRESLMHNYCLSKQIYTVSFLCGCLALGVWPSPVSVWCSLDADLAHWAANGRSPVAREGGASSRRPGCFFFVLFWCVCVTGCVFRLPKRKKKSNQSTWTYTQQSSSSSSSYSSCWCKYGAMPCKSLIKITFSDTVFGHLTYYLVMEINVCKTHLFGS